MNTFAIAISIPSIHSTNQVTDDGAKEPPRSSSMVEARLSCLWLHNGEVSHALSVSPP